ncbi:MAG: response regulator [Thiolinea sp.]
MTVLEDSSGQLTIYNLLKHKGALQSKWQPPQAPGYSLSAWWLRFDLVNQDLNNHDWYVQLQEVEKRTLQLYIVPTGQSSPVQIIPVIPELRRATFRLELPLATHYSAYLRVQNSYRPIDFKVSLLTANNLIETIAQDHISYAFVLGGLLAIAIYNLLTFFSLKERSYLSLTIFIVSNGIAIFSESGMLGLIFYNINGEYVNLVFSLIAILSGNSFFYQLMSVRERLPRLASLLRIHFWLTIFVLLIIYFVPFGLSIMSALGASLLVITVIILWILYQAKIPEARAIVWAFIVFAISLIPLFLFSFDLFENWFLAFNILMLGFLLFTVLLSLNQSTRTRELREQAQHLEASSRAKDAFLMTMSHELRTPMHAVVSGGALLQQTVLTGQQRDYVEKLQVSAQHMLSLINNILDVAKINHTNPDLKKHSFTLQGILENLEKLLGDQARHKGLSFKVSSDYPIENLLIGDPVSLSQILLNLLDNALKFTDIGSVSLIIKPVGHWLGKVELEFAVTDTGLGLSLKEQERLFEPFFQADSSVNRRYSGTGLGLTISHNLVRHLGGELQVKSKRGQGSCFFFKLLFELEQQPVSLPHVPITVGFYPDKRVLLVDDDPLNQFFGKELLKSLGVEVDLAESGESSLSRLEANKYNLVFMDVSMPGLDGYQTTQRIRQELKRTDLVIVALTAHAISGERERCLAAGMNDYLAKPFSIQELDEMLARYLLKKDS